MKRNILQTIVLLSVLALASCSTTNKVASTKNQDDDVYFSKAEAGEEPVYRQAIRDEDRYVENTGEGDDDDYYYYDSYASRINRFGYNSPFNYYDDYYYGYSPYGGGFNNYAFSPYGYGGFGGWGLGVGYGGGWGYGGLGYGGLGYGGFGYGGFGYGGFGYGGLGYGGFYSPYSYWGTGFGYGGGYWGAVSANNRVARPYRGSGYPTSAMNGGRSNARPTGYNGNYPNTMNYPGRRGTNSVGSNGSYTGGARPSRGAADPRPVYRPQRTEVSRPAYQPASVERSSGSSSSGSFGGGGGGGSRGGGRPSRP